MAVCTCCVRKNSRWNSQTASPWKWYQWVDSTKIFKHQDIKQKEPLQKYRLGTISTKLLAGLNRFYRYLKSLAILEAGTTHSDPGFDDYVATASFHTGARPGKRAQPHRNSSSDGKAPRGDIKCAFCDGGHRSNDCTTYSDAESRMKVVKDKRLCFNCLGKHPVAKCSSSNRCLKCRRKHHTTICNSRPAGNQPASLPTSSETAVLHSNTTLPDKEVLLKTAIANRHFAESRADNCQHPVRWRSPEVVHYWTISNTT